ncbi:MAG: hypothetical protein J2P46_08125 [Zavarzinella sp.]|nr:hypothetical protein [Zavarzinella sp.]
MAPSPAKLCVYCGSPADTVDHVPPKAIVPEPARNSIITVPACRACNNRFSKDDGYLMLLAMADESGASKDSAHVAGKVIRWTQKPNKKGQLTSLMKGLRSHTILTRAGRRLPTFTFQLDTERLLPSCRRIITALHYDLRRERMPPGFVALAVPPDDPQTNEIRDQLRLLFAYNNPLPPMFHKIGNDAFQYRFRGFPEAKGHYVWHLVFFGHLHVFGLIAEQDQTHTSLPVPVQAT